MSLSGPRTWSVRLASAADVPAITWLIPQSVRVLQEGYYTIEQRELSIGSIFGIDHQLIKDRTYFVAESEGVIVGCGGWSHRQAIFGPRAVDLEPGPILNPVKDAARIRAFFVHPDFARRGIGRAILHGSHDALRRAGYQRAELVGALAGEPLYASEGYSVLERFNLDLPNGSHLPVVRMSRSFEPL